MLGELGRAVPSERRMRPQVVVIVTPGLDRLTCVLQILEQTDIEALVSALAIETLGETVFDGPAWPNADEFHAIAVSPLI